MGAVVKLKDGVLKKGRKGGEMEERMVEGWNSEDIMERWRKEYTRVGRK